MSETQAESARRIPRPLPDNIQSVQPGGGICYQVELAWGRWRRWWLHIFRKGYVGRMAASRQGEVAGCPHEVLDPRDLKYCRNLCTADWNEADDPFRWREKIPFARWGLAELQLMGWPLLAASIGLAFLPLPYSLIALGPAVCLGLVIYFFRDPQRHIPTDAGLIVSPADGTIAEVTQLENDPYIGGPAVRIGIFLSIFNVHINRSPIRAKVIELRYKPGEFLNALNPDSVMRNEYMWIGLEEEAYPHRLMVVRQISGLIARRIVCQLRSGEVIERGEKFGMIKLGSRTELIVPAEGFTVAVQIGQKVKAGSTIFGRYTARED